MCSTMHTAVRNFLTDIVILFWANRMFCETKVSQVAVFFFEVLCLFTTSKMEIKNLQNGKNWGKWQIMSAILDVNVFLAQVLDECISTHEFVALVRLP